MLHAVAMFFAVPTLSPVSIHTLIPASRRSASTSGTPSCSLSSIAVAPWKVSSLSSSDWSAVIAPGCPSRCFARSSADSIAARYRLCHSSN